MKKKPRMKLWIVTLAVIMAFSSLCAGCGGSGQSGQDQTTAKTQTEEQAETGQKSGTEAQKLDRDGTYDSKDEVAEYLYEYGELPGNYMTKDQARQMGWEGGSLERYAPGKCIGGDHYGNYERNLPDGDYHECDIDTLGKKSRGPKRLVYSDEEIYYTGDHYSTFELMYDENGPVQ